MSLSPEKALGYFETAQSSGRLAHAYLIAGAAHSGKERLAAQVIAMVQGGEVSEVLDACEGALTRVLRPGKKSRVISVDSIRELERQFHLSVGGADATRVAVIVDADRMQAGAQNAFLKTLEEPPPNCLLLLLTSEPDQLLDTTRSRCICVNLLSPPLAGGESELESVLSAIGSSLSGGGKRDPSAALGLAGKFSGHLREVKLSYEKHYKDVLRAERETYKGAAESDFIEEREKVFLAQAQSDYLASRLQLCGILYAWLGDCLRQVAGENSSLDLPAQGKTTEAVGQALGETELLKRTKALEEMVDQLGTNAQEALVIEVGFLKAFG